MTAPDGGGDVLVGPAGWYRHPEGGERWWDGTAWTESERVDGKVRTVSRPATPQQVAERERERSWNRGRGRIVGWFVAAIVLWVVGGAAFQAAADRFPALERTTPAERVVTPATEDSPTAVYDVTFREAEDPAHPDSALGGQTVRLTFTLTKAFLGFLGWKVASVDGLPARAAG